MEQIEEWREIPGRDGYFISSTGRILGRRKHIIRGSIDKDGYNILCVDTRTPQVKTLKIHRLVYELFVGPIPEDRMINHKNGIKNDNRVENLELCTPSQNSLHAARVLGRQFGKHGKNRKGTNHPGSILTEDQVREIRQRHSQGTSCYAMRKDYPVSGHTLQGIVNRTAWKHVP